MVSERAGGHLGSGPGGRRPIIGMFERSHQLDLGVHHKTQKKFSGD